MNRTAIACASLAMFSTFALAPLDAAACGGFFCGGSGPQQVSQAAERIVFAEHTDGSVTAVIQILYNGPSDRFGWLLPVPGIPEVGLSSNAAFTSLQAATNPQYQMNTTIEGECATDDRSFANGANNVDAGASANNTTSTNNTGVTVVDRGSTGPYDYVVIQIDGAAGDKSQIALDWLTENNYQVTDVGPDLLTPYLDENYNLLAIRLQKTSDTGSIRPVRLKYDTDHPMIPIKLTAVAANEDMGVMTWLLGSSRAVPVNYKSLELNDALINWFNPTANYNDVVIAAANEASGQGFVTEYADSTADLGRVVFTQSDQEQWDYLSTTDWTGNEQQLLAEVISNYRFNAGWDGLREALEQAMPNATAEDIDVIMDSGFYDSVGEFPSFEAQALIDALEEWVVGPMRDTQDLMDEFGYITRMYTTMSAHEMTLDPSFDYNADLDDVSNLHTAERIIECNENVFVQDAAWRVELPSGLLVRGTGNAWPIVQDEMMPATLTVTELSTSGAGTVVRDNIDIVRERLNLANAEVPSSEEVAAEGGVGKKDVGGGGCSTAAKDGGLGPWLLLALVGLRRRPNRKEKK